MNFFLRVHLGDLLELGFLHVVHAFLLFVFESHDLVCRQRLTQKGVGQRNCIEGIGVLHTDLLFFFEK